MLSKKILLLILFLILSFSACAESLALLSGFAQGYSQNQNIQAKLMIFGGKNHDIYLGCKLSRICIRFNFQ